MKTASQVTKQLVAWSAENVRQIYERHGATDAYGVVLSKVRGLATELGTNHALALDLWKTGKHEARVIACTILDPDALTEKEARALLDSASYAAIADELVGRSVVRAPFADTIGAKWRDTKAELVRREGWRILAERVTNVAKAELPAILDRLEREMPDAPTRAKEGMNYCLVQIGTRFPEHTERAVAIGEQLGVWDVRPIPKGCTSAYAPEWIAVLLARKSPAWKARAAKAVMIRDEALRAAREAEKAAKQGTTKTSGPTKAAPAKGAKVAPAKKKSSAAPARKRATASPESRRSAASR